MAGPEKRIIQGVQNSSSRRSPRARRSVASLNLAVGIASLAALPLWAVEGAALKLSPELTAPAVHGSQQALASAVAVAPVALTVRDYRIGPEDLLEVQVFGVDQLSRTVRVNSRGLVSLPLIGAVGVGGMTAQEADAPRGDSRADRRSRSC